MPNLFAWQRDRVIICKEKYHELKGIIYTRLTGRKTGEGKTHRFRLFWLPTKRGYDSTSNPVARKKVSYKLETQFCSTELWQNCGRWHVHISSVVGKSWVVLCDWGLRVFVASPNTVYQVITVRRLWVLKLDLVTFPQDSEKDSGAGCPPWIGTLPNTKDLEFLTRCRTIPLGVFPSPVLIYLHHVTSNFPS